MKTNLVKKLSHAVYGTDQTSSKNLLKNLLTFYKIKNRLSLSGISFGVAKCPEVLDTIHHTAVLLALRYFHTSPIQGILREVYEYSLNYHRKITSLNSVLYSKANS